MHERTHNFVIIIMSNDFFRAHDVFAQQEHGQKQSSTQEREEHILVYQSQTSPHISTIRGFWAEQSQHELGIAVSA